MIKLYEIYRGKENKPNVALPPQADLFFFQDYHLQGAIRPIFGVLTFPFGEKFFFCPKIQPLCHKEKGASMKRSVHYAENPFTD